MKDDVAKFLHQLLPPTLFYFYEQWRDKHPDGDDFDLATFVGIQTELANIKIHSVREVEDLESVYHMWADAESGNEVSARLEDKGYRGKKSYRVYFKNELATHPSNVTFRPGGRSLLCTQDGSSFGTLALSVRVPPMSEDSQSSGNILVGIRVFDNRLTYWRLDGKSTTTYHWFPISQSQSADPKEGWQTITIDLRRAIAIASDGKQIQCRWEKFTSDANHRYTSKPDFSVIYGVTLEFALNSKGARPNEGVGVAYVADFLVLPTPPEVMP